MYILGRSISQGTKAGVLSVLGIINGALVHTILVAFGLSVIISQSEMAFTIIKCAGAIYLGYIGIKTLISKSTPIEPSESKKSTGRKIYLQGFLTNLLNPKVALFYLAFLPQFISKNNHYGALPFLILGFTFITTGTIWCLTLAIFSSKISAQLRKNRTVSNILNKATGLLFLGLGVNLLIQKI